eukprot:g5442.t1
MKVLLLVTCALVLAHEGLVTLASRPPISGQITWLYAKDLSRGASFVGEVVGLSEVAGLKQKDECRIFHAAPGHYLGVCDSRPPPDCGPGGPEGSDAPPVTYTFVVDTVAEVDAFYRALIGTSRNGTLAVLPKKPRHSEEFDVYAFNFYDRNSLTGLGCYRFEVQSFQDPAWPKPECHPIEGESRRGKEEEEAEGGERQEAGPDSGRHDPQHHATPTRAASRKPHIIHVLADDFGWAEVGYHRDPAAEPAATPVIDGLIRTDALELDRFYTHKICSPSRCAIQTGRAPVHVNVVNVPPETRNDADPEGGYQGVPVNMTGLGTVMAGGGYRTAFVGKWDVGMATAHHTPRARGYERFLGYWHHSNDYWSMDEGTCGGAKIKDLWRQNATFDAPARDLVNAPACSQDNQTPNNGTERCVFEEDVLLAEVKDIVRSHDIESPGSEAAPLFLFWSMHLVHMPLQVPQATLDRFASIDDQYRRKMHAMTSYLDQSLGQLIAELKAKTYEVPATNTGGATAQSSSENRTMWDDTLLVFHSDNGGEIAFAGICGGNNWPLTGGKFSNFEGGIRVNAFVAGGFLPPHRRGQKEDALVTSWDFYASYAALAGVDPTDRRAAAAGLPAHDSIDQGPVLWPQAGTAAAVEGGRPVPEATAGAMVARALAAKDSDAGEEEEAAAAAKSDPRTEIVIGDSANYLPNSDGKTLVGGLIQRGENGTYYKLLVGPADKLHRIAQYTQTGPSWPNKTSHLVPDSKTRLCGRKAKNGCLFELGADPTERKSLAEVMPERFNAMLARVDKLQGSVYSPDRGKTDPAACAQATGPNKGFWGPFV